MARGIAPGIEAGAAEGSLRGGADGGVEHIGDARDGSVGRRWVVGKGEETGVSASMAGARTGGGKRRGHIRQRQGQNVQSGTI